MEYPEPMSYDEIRAWRDRERERLGSLIDINSVTACKSVISILTAVLRDD